jgi:hypothetical protein
VSIVNGCRHKGKGDKLEGPPERRQGHGGRTLPPSPNPQEEMMKRRGEVTPPPHSPPHEALPSLGDIFSTQAGIAIGAHQSKWPRT